MTRRPDDSRTASFVAENVPLSPGDKPKIYLAGPEVFLRKPKKIGAAKVAICARHGLEGRFPLDVEVDLAGLSLEEQGLAIFRANEALLADCDALIANMTPFRGPSMDVGTAYEIGFMRGLKRPVFGYTNSDALFFERTSKFLSGRLARRKGSDPSMPFEDEDQMALEQFGLGDNLMLDAAIRESGTDVVRMKAKRRARYADLAAFEACVGEAAEILLAARRGR